MINLLKKAISLQADRVHIVSGTMTICQKYKEIIKISDQRTMSPQVYQLIDGVLTEKQKQKLLKDSELYTSIEIDEQYIARAHIYKQRSTLAISLKILKKKVRSLEEIGFDLDFLSNLLRQRSGLILIAGAPNSGKSSTCAAFVHYYAEQKSLHALRLSEALEKSFIEYPSSMVTQRLEDIDYKKDQSILDSILMSDIDVLDMGEIKNASDLKLACELSAKGLLVLASILASDIENILFKTLHCFKEPEYFRKMISENLLAMIHQSYFRNKSKEAFFIYEMFRNYPSVQKHLKLANITAIMSFLESGGKSDCLLYKSAFAKLVASNKIH
ncbi:Flp pilus assembly complex ATPase component TadA, partial [bacterium]|nr:Flp pilus assembly complex ATPase component TadA [bacterium]